jgi:type I restriction enzyme M protein
MSTSQSKIINDHIWSACDTFRGTIDPAQYKDYILVMLFLKYVSDVRKSHYEKYSKEYAGQEERIARKLEKENFVLPNVEIAELDQEGKAIIKDGKPVIKETFLADYYSLLERKDKDNIGELINLVLDQIENKNKKMLEGVFRNIDFNSEANLGRNKDRNRRLKALLENFSHSDLDLSPEKVSEDVIGEAYMFLIERFGSDAGKKAGEFFTPSTVSKLVAKLALPKPGNRIVDVTAGSGNLLLRAVDEIRKTGSENFSIYGQESNGSTWSLCRMNMFLHGISSARIDWCDTLNHPTLLQNDKLMQFNTIVGNPPFSLKDWREKEMEEDKYQRFNRGVPPSSNGDWAFISHMIAIASELDGRISVVVPLGVLFRGGAEQKIRKAVIEENLIDAVIVLPEKLFPTAGIPVAILILDKSRTEKGQNASRKDIIFINASKRFVPGKNQNNLSDDHIEEIFKAYMDRTYVEKFAKVVPIEEVLSAENDANLNVSRYVDVSEDEVEIDLDDTLSQINTISRELTDVTRQINLYLDELGLKTRFDA